MLLGEVSEVRTGLVLSRKKAADNAKVKIEYKALNLKCVMPEGYLNLENTEEYNATLFEIMEEIYDYDKQAKTMYEHTSLHPEEECDCQNLYAELTAILQEIAVNPDADCAALAEKAHNNYQTLLDIAQGD